MSNDSTLTLIIPDLFGFQSTLNDLSKDELSSLPEFNFPTLEKWLSRGIATPSGQQDDSIFDELSVSIDKNSDKPYAALALLSETNFTAAVAPDEYWLRADPVNLQADQDTALMTAHEALALTQDEANSLVGLINKHFVDEPWELFSIAPHRWYMRCDNPLDLKTVPLNKVLGGDINQFSVSGGDEEYWFKTSNEIQMLLHGANVNFERDSRNRITANSLWLWGGGYLPDANPDSSYEKLMTNNISFAGLGKHCGLDIIDLDDLSFDEIDLKHNTLVVLEMLSEHLRNRDLYSFVAQLNEMEEKVFSVADRLLAENKIKALKIITDGVTFNMTSKQNRRWLNWWKRVKPFVQFKKP